MHINKQLEAKVLGNSLNLERMSKTSHVSKTHALIQVSNDANIVNKDSPIHDYFSPLFLR